MTMRNKARLSALALAGLAWVSAQAGTLVINTDASDPAPKAAWDAMVKGFMAANPDVTVKVNTFDHEGFKTSIRNFLTADPPDIVTWYAGNRMAPFVNANLFEDVTDVWAKEGLNDKLKSAAIVLASAEGGKVSLIAGVTPDLTAKVKAGK